MLDHDVVTLAAGDFPCIFDTQSIEAYEAHGYAPRLTLAGKRSDGDTATIYGDGCETTLSVGDTVTKAVDVDGDEWGPFTVLVIRPDGTGAVEIQLAEA